MLWRSVEFFGDIFSCTVTRLYENVFALLSKHSFYTFVDIIIISFPVCTTNSLLCGYLLLSHRAAWVVLHASPGKATPSSSGTWTATSTSGTLKHVCPGNSLIQVNSQSWAAHFRPFLIILIVYHLHMTYIFFLWERMNPERPSFVVLSGESRHIAAG